MKKTLLTSAVLLAFTGSALAGNTLDIIGSGSGQMFVNVTSDDNRLVNVDKVYVESNGGRTGFRIKANNAVDLTNKTVILAGNGDARVELENGASLKFKNLISRATDGKVQLNDSSSEVTIHTVEVQSGGLNLQVMNSDGDATFNIGSINVRDGARFSACVYQENQSNMKIVGIDGNLNINLGEGAIVDMGGVKAHKPESADWYSDKLIIEANSISINVENIDNTGVVYLTKEGTDFEDTIVSVTAKGNDSSAGVVANLEKLANVVKMTSNDGDATTSVVEGAAIGAQLSISEGMYGNSATAIIGSNGKLTNVVEMTNSIMSNTLDLVSATPLAMNRLIMNDVRKRMGDHRSAEGTHGVWVRYDGGKLSGERGLENDFSTVQVGIDTAPVVDAPRFGMAFAYTKSDADMMRGSAEMDAFSLAFYGTKYYDSGIFVDVIGRVATANTDVVVDGNKNGSMDNVAWSLSGELGWRFDVTDRFYFEPQTELTYTYVNDDKLNLSGFVYEFDSVDSLMARVGFASGFRCPNNFGDVYVRASAVHEFLGDAAVIGGKNIYEVDGEDTWVEFGIGAQFNVNKNTYVYADIERTEGAKLEEDWRANVGVRFAF